MKISPARLAAFDILQAIETESAFSSALLAQIDPKLDPRDRSLCHELVHGVLRRQMLLDRAIDEFAAGKKLDQAVRIACRIGLYQKWYLDRVPVHSIVNESVNLTARARKSSAKGFVNAFLRRAASSPPSFEYKDEIERISTFTSHPRMLIERWADQFGLERAKAIAEANNERPALSFRATNRGKGKNLSRIEGVSPHAFIDGAYTVEKVSEEVIRSTDAGEMYFQDEASQMVGFAVASEGGRLIMDVCAAPGGKTAMIALANPGSTIIAGDRSGSRLSQVRELLLRQGVDTVDIIQHDAVHTLPYGEGYFDTVFVDAPCSGTGTIRHNPELRYHVSNESIAANALKQRQILENASKLVKPGGSLYYTTCSLERAENEEVMDSFSRADKGFIPAAPKVPAQFLTSDGFARTFPDRDRMDGFFIAAFRKA
jgi:16S rRNA (cytosine967-C5)-methyltransferase